jgi:hypothetical protein
LRKAFSVVHVLWWQLRHPPVQILINATSCRPTLTASLVCNKVVIQILHIAVISVQFSSSGSSRPDLIPTFGRSLFVNICAHTVTVTLTVSCLRLEQHQGRLLFVRTVVTYIT